MRRPLPALSAYTHPLGARPFPLALCFKELSVPEAANPRRRLLYRPQGTGSRGGAGEEARPAQSRRRAVVKDSSAGARRRQPRGGQSPARPAGRPAACRRASPGPFGAGRTRGRRQGGLALSAAEISPGPPSPYPGPHYPPPSDLGARLPAALPGPALVTTYTLGTPLLASACTERWNLSSGVSDSSPPASCPS